MVGKNLRSAVAGCSGLILLAACSAADCEPTVRGGSAKQAADVFDVAKELLERLKPHLNVCVRKIRLTEKLLPGGDDGGYAAWASAGNLVVE